jgi:polar amino acid transport system substrate-binding protein
MRALALVGAVLLAGCQVPADPDGTLDRVSGGTMRVGITESPPWTELRDGGRTGIEVDLAEDFARSLDARVEWTEGSEADLVEALERGELDLVIGGLTMRSPWSKHAAFTRPYAEATEQGRKERHVMAAPLGENAWLVRLERFLLGREAAVRARVEREVAR